MAGDPAVAANDPALELLRQMAIDARQTRDDVGHVRETVARMEGQGLPELVKSHALAISDLRTQLADLKADRRADVAQRKPWVFIAGEFAKLAVAALFGAAGFAATWWGRTHH